MAAAWTATFGDAQNIAFGSSTYTVSSATIGTGVFVAFFYDDLGRTHSGCTIGGVAATLVNETTDHKGSMWYASTSTATGNIVLTGGAAFGCVGSCGGLLTGVTAAPTANGVHQTNSVADPQTVTATVPSGGFGIAGLGMEAASSKLPGSWTSATRDAVGEAFIGTGNGVNMALAHTSTSGSQTPSATGSGVNGFGFALCAMVMGCWAPTAGATVGAGVLESNLLSRLALVG